MLLVPTGTGFAPGAGASLAEALRRRGLPRALADRVVASFDAELTARAARLGPLLDSARDVVEDWLEAPDPQVADLIARAGSAVTTTGPGWAALAPRLAHEAAAVVHPTLLVAHDEQWTPMEHRRALHSAPLATRLVTAVASTLLQTHRIDAHLVADGGTGDPAAIPHEPVVDATALAADPHDLRAGVVVLTGRSGRRWVHKARPTTGEHLVQQVVARCTAAGLPAEALAADDRGDHGWMAFAEAGPAADPDRLPAQLGVLLAVAHHLDLVDLHCENVVSTPAGPVIVDAEAFGARQAQGTGTSIGLERPGALDRALLPAVSGRGAHDWWDFSVLAATGGRATIIEDLDIRRDGRGGWLVEPHVHRIAAPDALIADTLHSLPPTWIDTLVEHLVAANEVLATGPGPSAAAAATARYIHRPTAPYLRSLVRLTDPAVLASWDTVWTELAAYVDDLGDEAESDPVAPERLGRELAALATGDVPRLTVDADRPRLPVRVRSVPADADVVRLACLTARRRDGADPADANDAHGALDPARARDRILAALVAPTGAVAAPADAGPGRWIGVVPDPVCGVPVTAPPPWSLYDGLAGTAVALALLDRRAPGNATGPVLARLVADLASAAGTATDASLADGPFGALYALLVLERSGVAGAADALARAAARFDPALVAGTDRLDVVSGVAGALLVALAVPSDAWLRARQAAVVDDAVARLLAAQRPDGGWPSLDGRALCGLSHGAAGIRLALGAALAGGHGPATRIAAAMDAGARFEARHRVADGGSWADLRFDEGDPRRSRPIDSWCHGSIGIALAEIGLARRGLTADPERTEPGLAAARTGAAGIPSLCCGRGGARHLLALNGDDVAAVPPPTAPGPHADVLSLFRGDPGALPADTLHPDTGRSAAARPDAMGARLADAEVDAFRRDGLLVRRAHLGRDWVDALRALVDEVRAAAPDLPWITGGVTGDRPVNAVHFPHRVVPDLAAWLLHGDLAAAAEALCSALLRVPPVAPVLVQTMLYLKPPGAPGQPWHQDERFTPTRDASLVTAWIPLEPADDDNGCLHAVPGSHTGLALRAESRVDEAAGVVRGRGLAAPAGTVALAVAPGDVAFLHGYTVHGSGPNRSGRGRAALVANFARGTGPALAELVAATVGPVDTAAHRNPGLLLPGARPDPGDRRGVLAR